MPNLFSAIISNALVLFGKTLNLALLCVASAHFRRRLAEAFSALCRQSTATVMSMATSVSSLRRTTLIKRKTTTTTVVVNANDLQQPPPSTTEELKRAAYEQQAMQSL